MAGFVKFDPYAWLENQRQSAEKAHKDNPEGETETFAGFANFAALPSQNENPDAGYSDTNADHHNNGKNQKSGSAPAKVAKVVKVESPIATIEEARSGDAAEERAAIIKYDCGAPRAWAEALAFEARIIQWLNRNPTPSQAGRCVWCGQLESESDGIVPFGTEPGTHAWLHSECWRPWQKARRAEAVKAFGRIGIRSDVAQREQT